MSDVLHELTQNRDLNRDVGPGKDMFAAGADAIGQGEDLLSTIGQEGDVLIGLSARPD